VQTSLPNHYVVECALQHDFLGFAEKELAARLHPLYPPHCRLVNVVVSGLDEGATQRGADAATAWIAGLLRAQGVTEVEVVGPAPCAIDRIRSRWRWHLLLRSDNATLLGKIARYFTQRFELPKGKDDLRIAVDRDPIALL
jgi:primosomal protein N' (replication factor Y)